MMRKLRLKRVITLAVCFFLLASLSVSLVFADEKEVSNFDNFKKVQSYKEGTFTDVKVDDWFHDNIVNLYEMKLMIGMSDSLFDTENSLKVSETFALAARINAIYTQSVVPEQIEGKNWFEPYVNYIKEKGIANPDDYDLSSSITRRQFAEIFAKTLPEEAFIAINDVKEGMIPDVTGDMELNKAIYTLFRSGILTGMDETRIFEPERTIKRSEAATIVSRIVNPKLRIDLGLPIIEEPVIPAPPVEQKASGGGGGSSSGGGGGGGNSPDPREKEYFSITAISDNPITVKLINKNDYGKLDESPMPLLYSINSKDDWQVFNEEDIKSTSNTVTLNKNDKMYIKAARKLDKLSYKNGDGKYDYRYFEFDDDDDPSINNAEVHLSGNIMSLLDPDMNLKDLSSKDGDGNYNYQEAFEMLFNKCVAITDASQLLLPATKLAPYCYDSMFYRCGNLVKAPQKIPANELAEYCCIDMFYKCTRLKEAPALPAKILAEGCYIDMFGETGLEVAPALPATILKNSCYADMFASCESLKEAPALPATTLADYCYDDMFMGCVALEEAPSLPATTLADYCYCCMFSYCTNLKNAPALPATELVEGCYDCMFYGCTNLEEAPALPATKLADGCYDSMFCGCIRLEDAPDLPVTELADYCYDSMFKQCTNLVNAPALPATELADSCYSCMFMGCTNLVNTPELPATELADYCYDSMFKQCTNLVNAPELPSTTLADGCYKCMFEGCTNLVNAPELSSTTLAKSCYHSMFDDCTSLANAPLLPATELADSCYYYMFSGCTSLLDAPALPATTLADYCYYFMFYKCTNLKNVAILSDEFIPSNATTSWLSSVTANNLTVTITKKLNETGFSRTNSTIPTGATIKVLPEKGDLIYLDNNKDELYQVLNRDGVNLELITTQPVGVKEWTTTEVVKGVFSNLVNYPLYGSSLIDSWLNGDETDDYYHSLSDNIKNAIVQKEIVQKAYEVSDTEPASYTFSKDTTYFTLLGTVSLGLRNVYLPGLEDIINFFKDSETDNGITIGELKSLVGDNSWLRDHFSDQADTDYQNSKNNFASFTVDARKIDYEEYDKDNYFCITSTGEDQAKVKLVENNESGGMTQMHLEYSTDKENWTPFVCSTEDTTNTEIVLNKDDKVYFRSTEPVYELSYDSRTFVIDDDDDSTNTCKAKVELSGNILSLLDPECKIIDLSSKDESGNYYYSRVFANLFLDCTAITDAGQLLLPATELAESCYESMFEGCTSLVNPPELPARELAEYCYSCMFYGCTNLVDAAELPARELVNNCYDSMFGECTNLVNAPELPATTLADECYLLMFDGCTHLVNAPELPATTLENSCYYKMFEGCEGLVDAPELPATTLADKCYYYMFYKCTNLKTLIIGFEKIPDNAEVQEPIVGWLFDVPPETLTIYVPTGFEIPQTRNESTIPSGATVIEQ